MTRNAMPQLDSFDPEVLDAARDVAARAGVPLETWIASVVPQAAGRLREATGVTGAVIAPSSSRTPTSRPETATRTRRARRAHGQGRAEPKATARASTP